MTVRINGAARGGEFISNNLQFYNLYTNINIEQTGNYQDATQKDLLHALHKAIYVAGFLVLAASGVLCYGLFHDRIDHGMRYYGCIVIGLFAGVCIGVYCCYCVCPCRRRRRH